MAAVWLRDAVTTIKDYSKGYNQEMMRQRFLLAMLKSKGRIRFNTSGNSFTWNVQFKRAPMSVNNGTQTVSFSPVDRFKQAELAHEGYILTDSMTKLEKLQNRGKPALIEYFSKMVTQLMSDADDAFHAELYIDGNATGNEGRMQGIDSFMGNNGTINYTSGAQRSANTADPFGYPSDTYATLTTGLGDYGGSTTSGVWPWSDSTEEYDFWSPVLVNYNASYFGNATNNWANNSHEAMRIGIMAHGRNKLSSGKLDFILLDRELLYLWLNTLDSKERINVENTAMRKLGFPDAPSIDGIEVRTEYGVTGSCGYGFSLDNMEIRSLQDQLFKAEGPIWNRESSRYRVSVDCLGQICWKSPRSFIKYQAISAAS